ncbi:MAG: DUF4190 domain-containing protein [Phycisphaerales bacterium]|nr:DUF4190 domain-containing protein [Phycisphaerales bacterium]
MTFDQPANSSNQQVVLRPTGVLSALAVVGLILAVIPCCPPINALGSVLGLVALRRIDASAGGLRGRGLALGAIWTGLALTLMGIAAWIWVTDELEAQYRIRIEEATQSFIQMAMSDDPASALTLWGGDGTPPSSAELTAFGIDIEKRFGQLQSFTLLTQEVGGWPLDRWQAAGEFQFEKVRLTGGVELAVETGELIPNFRISAIEIDDPSQGSLRLPPLPEKPSDQLDPQEQDVSE